MAGDQANITIFSPYSNSPLMSTFAEKMAARKKLALVSQATRIAEEIEAKQMAAPDLRGKIKKWIQEEIEAALNRRDEKLMGEITNAVKAEVKAEVNNYCKGVFSTDDDYYAVVENDESQADSSLSPPKLERQ